MGFRGKRVQHYNLGFNASKEWQNTVKLGYNELGDNEQNIQSQMTIYYINQPAYY